MGESIPLTGSSGKPPRTELQIRVASGEPARSIIEELYRRLQIRLLTYVRKWIKNSHDAEDVVQRVFEKMLINFEAMIACEPVEAWIFTVARREAIDQLRKSGREVPAESEILGEEWLAPGSDEEATQHIDTAEQVLAHLRALAERGSISRADLHDYWQHVVMEVTQRELARDRGVTQPRVSQREKATSIKVRISLYLGQVLGTIRTPYRVAAISEHLDIFDLDPGPLKDSDRELLRRAGSAVTRGPDDVVALRREDAKAALEATTLEELHDAESVYAAAIGNPTPNCIARPCERHVSGMGGETR